MKTFEVTFEITHVSVLQGRDADKVSLHTTESSPTPGITKQPLCLDFTVAARDGPEYVRQLGFPDDLMEIIDV